MDSAAPILQKLRDWSTPFWAIVTEDIRQTVRHWAFIAWALLGVFFTVIWLLPTADEPTNMAGPPPSSSYRWSTSYTGQPTAPAPALSLAAFAAKSIRYHLLIWVSFVVALGATAISAESQLASDAILCRGVSRYQYYLGKCAARSGMVALLFVVLTLLAIGVGLLRLDNDLTREGFEDTIELAAGFLALVTVLSVAGGVWFHNPLIAFAVMWMVVYGVGIVAAVLEMNPLSPVTLADQLPTLLRGPAEFLPDHHLVGVLAIVAAAVTIVSLGRFAVRDV